MPPLPVRKRIASGQHVATIAGRDPPVRHAGPPLAEQSVSHELPFEGPCCSMKYVSALLFVRLDCTQHSNVNASRGDHPAGRLHHHRVAALRAAAVAGIVTGIQTQRFGTSPPSAGDRSSAV